MVKKVKSILVILFSCGYVMSQEIDSIIGLGITEEMPEYKGGYPQLKDFIDSVLVYPEQAISDSIEGTVYVGFYVDTTGKTIQHKVLKGIRDDINQEALRIAKQIKFHQPARVRGKPVRITYELPIRFILPEKKNSKYGGNSENP